MNSCPESEKIRALRSGSLSAEETRRLQSHIKTCSACRQELDIETAIDRELALEIRPPEIEGTVLQALRTLDLADAKDGRQDFYKYIFFAALILIFGSLVAPYLIHVPTDWIGRIFSAERLRPLVDAFRSNLPFAIGIGAALMFVSLIFSFPRLRKVLEL